VLVPRALSQEEWLMFYTVVADGKPTKSFNTMTEAEEHAASLTASGQECHIENEWQIWAIKAEAGKWWLLNRAKSWFSFHHIVKEFPTAQALIAYLEV
jgi:hypothetical protein